MKAKVLTCSDGVVHGTREDTSGEALAAFLAVGITILGALMFGRRWWTPFLILGSAVMLTLLLAPDAYLAFGWAFAFTILGALTVVFVPRVRAARIGRSRGGVMSAT